MPKNFKTNKRYWSEEEKFRYAIEDYFIDTNQKPIYCYPPGYKELSDEEMAESDKIYDLMYQAFLNDDLEEEERLRALLPDITLPQIDIEKSLVLIPELFRENIFDFVKKEIYDETITLKCLNCDYEEEVDYEIVEECWMDGPYPISYCPHCDKPKFVPLDVYNKRKLK